MATEKDAASDQITPEFDPTENNIESIVWLEEVARRERTWGERVSDGPDLKPMQVPIRRRLTRFSPGFRQSLRAAWRRLLKARPRRKRARPN
jgi:hypothetical protein